MSVVSIDKIANLDLGVTGPARDKFVSLIGSALGVAVDVLGVDVVDLPGGASLISFAGTAALQSVNALLTAASVKCHLTPPPEDIAVKLTGTGRLVYRCYHSPAHEWDLTGNPLP